MMTLATALTKKIASFPHPTLRAFLLKHLKDDPTTLNDVFYACEPPAKLQASELNQYYSFDTAHTIPDIQRVQTTELLSLVYKYAPSTVCIDFTAQLLQLPEQEALGVLLKYSDFYRSPLHTLLCNASETTQKQLATFIDSLSAKHLTFFIKTITLSQLFKYCEEDLLFSCIANLKKLSRRQLTELFNEGRLISQPILILGGFLGEDGLVNLFESARGTANALIKLVKTLSETLDNTTLYSLLQGAATPRFTPPAHALAQPADIR